MAESGSRGPRSGRSVSSPGPQSTVRAGSRGWTSETRSAPSPPRACPAVGISTSSPGPPSSVASTPVAATHRGLRRLTATPIQVLLQTTAAIAHRWRPHRDDVIAAAERDGHASDPRAIEAAEAAGRTLTARPRRGKDPRPEVRARAVTPAAGPPPVFRVPLARNVRVGGETDPRLLAGALDHAERAVVHLHGRPRRRRSAAQQAGDDRAPTPIAPLLPRLAATRSSAHPQRWLAPRSRRAGRLELLARAAGQHAGSWTGLSAQRQQARRRKHQRSTDGLRAPLRASRCGSKPTDGSPGGLSRPSWNFVTAVRV